MQRNWWLVAMALAGSACGETEPMTVPESDDAETTGNEPTETEPAEDEGDESGESGELPPANDAGDDESFGEAGGSGEGGCVGECCEGDACEDECASDADCAIGELCGYADHRTCLALPRIEGCDEFLVQTGDVGITHITSLDFVDPDGDGREDLAIGRAFGVALVSAKDGEPAPLVDDLGQLVRAVVDGDFTADGRGDLLVAGTDGLVLFEAQSGGGYGRTALVPMPEHPAQVETLRWNGSGMDQLAVRLQNGRVQLLSGVRLGAPVLPLPVAGARDIAAGDVDLDRLDDLGVETGGAVPIFLGNPLGDAGSDLSIGSDAEPAAGIVAGQFTDAKPDAIARHRNIADTWSLVEGGSGDGVFLRQALFATGSVSDVGDLDGDGYDDLVLVDTWEVTVAFGGGENATMFTCSTSHGLVTPASMVAVGDLDGDGRDDIAVSHGVDVTLLALP